MTMVQNSNSTTKYSAFDALGRVTTSAQITGDTYTFPAPSDTSGVGYEYNRAGGLKSIHYPSGLVINYAFDGAGRVNQVFNYADAVGYASHGAVNSLTLHNGVTETSAFNSRLQVQAITAATSSSPLLALDYA